MKLFGSFLEHYGVKGQKWGVRRYQNPDGSYTDLGRRRAYALRTHRDVEKIFNSFSKKDKQLLDAGEDDNEYMSREATAYWVAKRFVSKHGDEPVAFMDVIKSPDSRNAQIAIGVDANHRGEGYADKLAKRGAEWIDQHMDEFDNVEWGAYKENPASIRLAQKNGFQLERETDDFVVYSKNANARFKTAEDHVRNEMSNDPKDLTKHPAWIQEVKKRGKLSDAEAKQCSDLASDIYDRAASVEPAITKDVISAVSKSGGSMFGLENRLKTPTSLAAKIGSNAKYDKVSFEKASKSIKDSIRYTSVSNDDNFVRNYNGVKNELERKGYKEIRCRNYFDMYRNKEVSHKSVQSVYADSKGNTFEIQFQTVSSQAAKELKRPLYEKRRQSGLSDKQKSNLEKQMRDLAERVSDPEDVFKILSHD